MEQHTLKHVNNCLNTNIYSYLETSGGQSSNLYLCVVHLDAKKLVEHQNAPKYARENASNNAEKINTKTNKNLYINGHCPNINAELGVFHIWQVFSKSHASLLAFPTLTDETQIRPILFVPHHPGLPMQVQPLP